METAESWSSRERLRATRSTSRRRAALARIQPYPDLTKFLRYAGVAERFGGKYAWRGTFR